MRPEDLGPATIGALQWTAKELGIPWEWLFALIDFESAWKPAAVNPLSGAVGLIQFLPRTLKSMGLVRDDLAEQILPVGAVPDAVRHAVISEFLGDYPDRDSQLRGPVLDYLKPGAPYRSRQELYMEVFYPAARDWPATRVFPESVRRSNPGIDTVESYVSKVDRRLGSSISVSTGAGIGVGLGVLGALVGYLIWGA